MQPIWHLEDFNMASIEQNKKKEHLENFLKELGVTSSPPTPLQVGEDVTKYV